MTPFPAYWMQIVQKWALRSSSEVQQSRLPTSSFLMILAQDQQLFLGTWFLFVLFVPILFIPIPMLLIPIPRLFIPIPGFPILFVFIFNFFICSDGIKSNHSKLSETIYESPSVILSDKQDCPETLSSLAHSMNIS